jgi:ABC-type multidrug transport system ATPase subunit
MPAALQVEQLIKDYPLERTWREIARGPFSRKVRRALDGLTLAVARGERVALVGPNGAGKTTLARIACGVVLPDRGVATVDGEDATRGTRGRSRVGFARPDDPALHPRLSALEALRFHAALYDAPGEAASLRRALEEAEAGPLAARRIQTLSAGEKARVSMAKALLHAPRLLILDEISRVLDPGASARARTLLEGFARGGGAVLLITHDLAEAARCDRTIVVKEGRVVADGSWTLVEPMAREVFAL